MMSDLSSGTLCSICKEFDFSIFSPAAYPTVDALRDRSDPFFARNLDDLQQSTQCPFCRLVLATLSLSSDWPPSLPSSSLDIRLEVQTFANTLPAVPSDAVLAGRRLWVSAHLKGSPPKQNDILEKKYRHYRRCIHLEANTTVRGNKGFLFRGREVPPLLNLTSLGLIRGWLDGCELSHQCRPPTPNFTKGMTFRLIDVCLECVVDAPKDPKYASLSYVWGGAPQTFLTKETYSSLTTPGALSTIATQLPATIRDAIQLCRLLNEPYLWVDSLCIIQDSPEDKAAQIHQMDSVYAGATLTIVAASGSDCSFGLPGISVPRPPQQRGRVAGIDLITVDQSVQIPLSESKYNTRGWTFQEHALSRRLLVFLESQVLFYCNETLFREDLVLEFRHDNPDKGPFLRLYEHSVMPARVVDSRYNLDSQRKVYCHHYGSLVASFVVRDLTYDSDVLDAFTGISNTLTTALGSSPDSFHYGLLEDLFGLALLWSSSPTLPLMAQRRRGFPSWSWAGWKFNRWVFFSNVHPDLMLLDVVSFYKFRVPPRAGQDVEGTQLSYAAEAHRLYRPMLLDTPPFANGRVLSTTLHPFLRQQLGGTISEAEEKAAIASMDLQVSASDLLLLPSLVLFKTSHARLHVSASPWSPDYPHYSIAHNPSYCVVLEPAWRARQPEVLDFVLVALRGTPEGQGPGYELEVWAMVVEWVGGVAERVAVCKVKQSDWVGAGAAERVVVLG